MVSAQGELCVRPIYIPFALAIGGTTATEWRAVALPIHPQVPSSDWLLPGLRVASQMALA